MSDEEVLRLIQVLEDRLADDAWIPDPEWLQGWNEGFLRAVGSARRGPGWEGILGRAHALGARLPKVVEAWRESAEEVRRELTDQARGNRALKGYGSQTR
ncbi:MAG: hypothetical protein HY823_08415 [Acidobacteria bacterium]|nr:hypothetical protein [Acidobacteriota bacterium]